MMDWDVEQTISAVRGAAARGVKEGAERVLSTAISHILNDPKTGRIYTKGGSTHQASAPGEAPASWTGKLVNSSFTEDFPDMLTSSAVFQTKYAEFLEYGTRKMEQRPYARRSLEEERESIDANIEKRISDALRSGK